MAYTLGRFNIDTDFHGLTTVPGLFRFSLDVRAYDARQLEELKERVLDIVPGSKGKRRHIGVLHRRFPKVH